MRIHADADVSDPELLCRTWMRTRLCVAVPIEALSRANACGL